MANLITIGIPAYNRKEALLHVLSDLVRQGVHQMPGVEVLVIDDDSPDGSYQAALPYHGMGGIRVLRNAERQGFRGNFIKLIEHCDSEYLLYSCDDDFVLGEGIARLRDYLAAETAPPALLSSLFYDQGAVYRANAERITEIGLGEYRTCCAHMPGVVFNARLAKAVWPRIEPFLRDPRNVYPQCCLALVLLLFGYRGVYYPVELVRTGYDLESGLVAYATVGERWKQFLFFSELLEHLVAHIQDPAPQARAAQLLEQHKLSLFLTLGTGVSAEKPELTAYYLQGARLHLGGG